MFCLERSTQIANKTILDVRVAFPELPIVGGGVFSVGIVLGSCLSLSSPGKKLELYDSEFWALLISTVKYLAAEGFVRESDLDGLIGAVVASEREMDLAKV